MTSHMIATWTPIALANKILIFESKARSMDQISFALRDKLSCRASQLNGLKSTDIGSEGEKRSVEDERRAAFAVDESALRVFANSYLLTVVRHCVA